MGRIVTISFLLFTFIGFSQDREAAIWHFGQFAGLDFNSLSPVSLDDGKTNTIEGTSTTSDSDGNLLFYSDGVYSYTRNHQVMSNGSDLLGGHFSTQSALIVPRPESDNYHYLFTVSEHRVGNSVYSEGDGLNYYTVNIGSGSVNSLSRHLVTYDASVRQEELLKCSQKLTAIKDPDQEVYWVLTHFRDSFYAFKVDENGVTDTPVVSTIGPTIFLGAYAKNAKGQLKFSPDGKKVVMASFQNSLSEGHSPGNLYLFDFNMQTGTLSNPIKLMDDDYVFAYGAEFSPNSKVVYATVSSFKNGNVPPSGYFNNGSILVQIDLENNYRYRKLHDFPDDPTALQLAIDGKIYMAHQRRRLLGVINYPNVVGRNADFDPGGLSIGRTSQRGLPSFVQSYFQVRVDFEEACVGEPTQIFTNYLPEPDAIDWNFGDGNELLGTQEKRPIHVYDRAGSYLVTATITKDGITETYSKQVQVRNLPVVQPATLVQCDDNGDGISIFNLNEASTLVNSDPSTKSRFFYSMDDAEAETNEILGITYFFSNELASQVFVRVENEFGCYRITTLDLQVQNTAIPQEYKLDYHTCDDIEENDPIENYSDGIGTFDFSLATSEILALFPNRNDLTVSYFRNEQDALAEIRAIDPTNYRNEKSPFIQDIWVRVDGATNNGCIGLGQHLTLHVDAVPDFLLDPQLLVCERDLPYRIGPDDPQGAYEYRWVTEEDNVLSTSGFYDIAEEGKYTLLALATDGTGCSFERSIEITSIKPAVIKEVDVEGLISFQSSATVILENPEGYEFSLDDSSGPYQNSSVLTQVPPGIHQVFVRDVNGCEIVSTEFSVIGYPPFFTPNNDGANDYWQIQGISSDIQPNSLVYIYDRFGNFLSKVDPASQGWDGIMNGKTLPASDYWFTVTLDDGRTFSGHFALVR